MATSGTSSFAPDFTEIIEEAYERCGKQDRTGYDLRTARRSLNLLFSEWANRGLNLWTIEQRSLVLSTTTAEYALPLDTINVLSAVIRSGTGSTQLDITLDRISRAEYLHTPSKNLSGRPAQYYVERSATPKVLFEPSPDGTAGYTFVYYALRRMEDVGDYTNTADLSFRFLPSMVAGLSYYLSLKIAPDRTVLLKQLYEEEFQRAAYEDRDTASLRLVPDM
jgi:hypothetical protein